MRLLFVNYEYPPLGGGGGIAMKEVAEELANRHEVHILTSGASGLDPVERHSSLNVTIHRASVPGRTDRATASFASMLGFLTSGIRLGTKLLREHDIDAINSWFAVPSGITGAALARKREIPHLLTVIGGDIYDPSKWYSPHRFPPAGLAVRWVLKHVDEQVAISTDISERARKYFGRKIDCVIPLGIKARQFVPASREQLRMDPSKKYVVSVGRLVRRKDYPTLLQALRELDQCDVHLMLLGDGPERNRLIQMAHEMGIGERVHFRGFVAEEIKYQILSNSDVFALVSLHEGFGIVYLEALCCGLPVIAAETGGQTDIINASTIGRLVPVGNVNALTEALRGFLDHGGDVLGIRKHRKRRFEEFSISRLAGRYETTFQTLARL